MQPQEKIKKRHLMDYTIFVPYIILCVIGLIMVYSSTTYVSLRNGQNPAKMVLTQSIFWALGLVMIFLIYHMKNKVFQNRKFMTIAMGVVIALLIYAALFNRNNTTNGSSGWIYIGSFSMQPAEYLKILIIWYLALTLSHRQKAISRHWYGQSFKTPILMSAGMIILVAVSPDMGNAMILAGTVAVMLLVSGITYKWTFILLPVGVVGAVAAVQTVILSKGSIFPGKYQYIYSRFQAFADPFAAGVERDAGHQLVNSYYAISNGGWLGRGLGNSIEKNGYLPEAHTDFIFSIVVEELGLIVAILILALLLFMIGRIIYVGVKAVNPFNSMMALGIGSMLLIQLFVNLGGIIGLIPSTGVTFPFLSQGGNSLLVLSIAIAFVLNISADERRIAQEKRVSDYYNGMLN